MPILDDPERRCCEQTVTTYCLEKNSEKFPIQQNELKLAPITPTHNGVLVITCA